MAKEMGEEYIEELDNPSSPEEEDDDKGVSSNIDFGVKMVGVSATLADIKDQLLRSVRPDGFGVFSVIGAVGCGRSLDAQAIYEDLYIHREQSFDCGAWVRIGPNYQIKEILLSILAQLGNNELLISQGDNGEKINVGEYLYTRLEDKRYMIVLDDVRDTQLWSYLRSSFPQQDNGSLVLLTSNLMEVAESANSFPTPVYPALGEEQLWDFIRLSLFDGDEEKCPPELEKAGKKIAENCKGYDISAFKVILFLQKAGRTPEYWNKLAADEENSIFKVEDEISEMLKIREELQLYPDDDDIQFIGKRGSPDNNKPMKMVMFPERLLRKMEIISLVGMAGIGKTALVKETFEDPSIVSHFDYCVWVTLGPKYKSKDILVDILAQIYPDYDKMHVKGDEELAKALCKQLSHKRCLIVLDDVWNNEPLHYLKMIFPDIKGKALVTTRLKMEFGKQDIVKHVHLLNEKESWCLFRQKVFAGGLCPPELENVGKKIARYCEGLPLMILTVADLLSKEEKTLKYWNNVAKKQNSVLLDAHDQISKVLLPSYEYLPQHLRAYFLYMGIFSQKYAIPFTRFIMLCTAEGFFEPSSNQIHEDFVAECLNELTSRSLVIRRSLNNNEIMSIWLHSVFWYLSNGAAVKNKFFHALNSYFDNSTESIKSQRRLSIRKSILLGMKGVHDLMASISTARSLLCTGPFHHYPVPIYFDLRLLRVLDALAIRLYDFPVEVLKLIHLRYLALTCNGMLPTSISKLWNLQHLVISRYLRIKSSKNVSCLPMNIWDMKELKHLQVMGGCLPNPNPGVILPNLRTLLDVNAESCTEEVLKGIPSLKTLGIQIEVAPDDDSKPFHFLNHISCLNELVELKCVVVNHESRSKIAAPVPISMFSSSLVKVSLEGLGYPWECMTILGDLENLEVLKLRCYAFQGPEWETKCHSFCNLKFLSIEDTDLVRWKRHFGCFDDLDCLILKHCYKLEELPRFWNLETIEVVDCNPYTVTWVEQRKRNNSGSLKAHVHSSWDAKNLKQ